MTTVFNPPLTFILSGKMIFIGYVIHVTTGTIVGFENPNHDTTNPNLSQVGDIVPLSGSDAQAILATGIDADLCYLKIALLPAENVGNYPERITPKSAENVEDVYAFYIALHSSDTGDEGGIAAMIWGIQPEAIWEALNIEDEGAARVVTVDLFSRGKYTTSGSTHTEIIAKGGEVLYRGHPGKNHYEEELRFPQGRSLKEHIEVLIEDGLAALHWFTHGDEYSYTRYREEIIPPTWENDAAVVVRNFSNFSTSDTASRVARLMIDVDTLNVTITS